MDDDDAKSELEAALEVIEKIQRVQELESIQGDIAIRPIRKNTLTNDVDDRSRANSISEIIIRRRELARLENSEERMSRKNSFTSVGSSDERRPRTDSIRQIIIRKNAFSRLEESEGRPSRKNSLTSLRSSTEKPPRQSALSEIIIVKNALPRPSERPARKRTISERNVRENSLKILDTLDEGRARSSTLSEITISVVSKDDKEAQYLNRGFVPSVADMSQPEPKQSEHSTNL